MTLDELTTTYRDTCAVLERLHGYLLPDTYRPSERITWEAFGLASDMRNSWIELPAICAFCGIPKDVLVGRWRLWFPELLDPEIRTGPVPPANRHPLHDKIIELVKEGATPSRAAKYLGVSRGTFNGIAWRWRKKQEKLNVECTTDPQRARLALRQI